MIKSGLWVWCPDIITMVQILNWLGREVKDDGWYNGWMMFHNGMVWMMEPFFYWVPDLRGSSYFVM